MKIGPNSIVLAPGKIAEVKVTVHVPLGSSHRADGLFEESIAAISSDGSNRRVAIKGHATKLLKTAPLAWAFEVSGRSTRHPAWHQEQVEFSSAVTDLQVQCESEDFLATVNAVNERAAFVKLAPRATPFHSIVQPVTLTLHDLDADRTITLNLGEVALEVRPPLRAAPDRFDRGIVDLDTPMTFHTVISSDAPSEIGEIRLDRGGDVSIVDSRQLSESQWALILQVLNVKQGLHDEVIRFIAEGPSGNDVAHLDIPYTYFGR